MVIPDETAVYGRTAFLYPHPLHPSLNNIFTSDEQANFVISVYANPRQCGGNMIIMHRLSLIAKKTKHVLPRLEDPIKIELR